jgi:polar amino acid transport system substrate-binding protein
VVAAPTILVQFLGEEGDRVKSWRLTVMLLALLLAVAACGGSDDDAADDSGGGGDAAAEDTPAEEGEENAAGDGECGVDQLELFEPGQLTVATGDPAFPPWVIDDDPSSGEGFEAAVVYALAEEMGFAEGDVEWVRTGFDEAIAPGDKPYDFNLQQYSITDERAQVVDFSIPYYTEQKSVVALEGSEAASATTFDELAEASLGATIGTTDLDYIEQELGVTDAAVYDTQEDTVAAMQAGQIDATVVGLSVAHFLTSAQVENAVIAGVLPEAGAATEGEGMGLLFTKDSGLVPCVNAALETLTTDGTLDALAEEWLQQGGDIPEITR